MGVEVRGQRGLFDVQDSLDELARLAHTAGIEVLGRDLQRLDAVHADTYIGSGKVEQLLQLRGELQFNVLLFDDELSPAQLRNLEKALEIKIIDRTALILDIFALHARTAEGALQVEMAQYAYRLPRLTHQWTHLSRQTQGGVGLRGPGETQLELDRRQIVSRMAQLRDKLDQVRQTRALQRRRRRRQGLPTVAIVGYTNAGKSTLLNRLAGAEVLVEDKLFATLDPTTRRVALPSGKEALFTDTVGFIQKLPTELVAAFRATLEEVEEADVLIHLVDASSPHVLEQIQTVEEVLAGLEMRDQPIVLALNKVDLLDSEQLEPGSAPSRFVVRRSALDSVRARHPAAILLSAAQGLGIDELLTEVEAQLAAQMTSVDVLLPYQAGDLLNLWRKQGIIDDVRYEGQGARVRGHLPRWMVDEVLERAAEVKGQRPTEQ
ncbi:MAG: GTPase HflX [Chloroflexi bacterium]|nr:GTPase HflX [Chloroflexota bacterium]